MHDLSFDRVIEFAQALIRTPGPPGGEADVAARTCAEYRKLGFDDAWTDEAGNAIGRIRGRGEAATVMVSCHLDVVDIGDESTWEHPPFGGNVEAGFLHGRGAMDIKGPLAIQTYAAAHFVDDRPAGDILVAHTVMEERGGWGMEHLLDKGDVRPDVVIIGESTNGDICIGHRGRAELAVDIEGVAGHASAPDRAHNPLSVLSLVLPQIERFAEQLATDTVLGGATLAPTAVETLPTSYNVIPDIARIIVDWRVLPDTTAEQAAGRLESFLRANVQLPEPFTLKVYFSTEQRSGGILHFVATAKRMRAIVEHARGSLATTQPESLATMVRRVEAATVGVERGTQPRVAENRRQELLLALGQERGGSAGAVHGQLEAERQAALRGVLHGPEVHFDVVEVELAAAAEHEVAEKLAGCSRPQGAAGCSRTAGAWASRT